MILKFLEFFMGFLELYYCTGRQSSFCLEQDVGAIKCR